MSSGIPVDGRKGGMAASQEYSGVRPHKEKINISKEIINKNYSSLYGGKYI